MAGAAAPVGSANQVTRSAPRSNAVNAPGPEPTAPHPSPGDVSELRPRARMEAAGEKVAAALEGSNPNEAIADRAREMVGTSFKPEEEARCADFTSTVIEGADGPAPDGFFHTVTARDFAKMGGEPIAPDQLQPGDVVAFNNTYRNSTNEQDHTHVGVYVGDGQFVHRPTNQADYLPGSKPGEVVMESIEQYLQRDRGTREATIVGGYRLG